MGLAARVRDARPEVAEQRVEVADGAAVVVGGDGLPQALQLGAVEAQDAVGDGGGGVPVGPGHGRAGGVERDAAAVC